MNAYMQSGGGEARGGGEGDTGCARVGARHYAPTIKAALATLIHLAESPETAVVRVPNDCQSIDKLCTTSFGRYGTLELEDSRAMLVYW